MASTYNPLKDREKYTAQDWHNYWVFEDEEFHSERASLDPSDPEAEFKLAYEYRIDINYILGEVGAAYFNHPIIIDNGNEVGGLDFNKEEELISVSFYPFIKHREYKEAWQEIEKYQKYLEKKKIITRRKKDNIQRRRAPEDTRLIYAIFKARKKLSFPEIYKLYAAGTLPYYEDGPTNNYSGDKSLERFYNKYKP